MSKIDLDGPPNCAKKARPPYLQRKTGNTTQVYRGKYLPGRIAPIENVSY